MACRGFPSLHDSSRRRSQIDPPAGEVIKARNLLGGDDWIALDNEADAGAEPNPRCDGCRCGQGSEHIQIVNVVRR